MQNGNLGRSMPCPFLVAFQRLESGLMGDILQSQVECGSGFDRLVLSIVMFLFFSFLYFFLASCLLSFFSSQIVQIRWCFEYRGDEKSLALMWDTFIILSTEIEKFLAIPVIRAWTSIS